MDSHKKSIPLGVESHGSSHLCIKCGWNFPNPHPSAKHRRAHKKVCGKIDDDLTVVSDDDPLSPSPKSENRLVDVAFVDSVMEFSDSGLKPPGKSEQVGVVEFVTEQQLNVDTAEDCIEKLNIGKEGCLEHNLDILETQENHLGTNAEAASEEIVSSVETISFNVAPSNLLEEHARVEDLNLGSMVQDFSAEVETRQEEEDNSPVDESVHVFLTKEPKDELPTRNNTEVVKLEEDAKDRETIELEKSPQNLSSLKDTILNGNDENKGGLTMDDDKKEILPPHGNNYDAEFSSLAADDDAIAILNVSDIEKGGSLRHNLDETPINELGNSTASEEVTFSDTTDSTMAEVRPNEDQLEIPPVDILSVIKTKISSDPPCLEKDQEESNNLSDSSAHKLFEAASGTTYFDASHPLENNTGDNLKMVIPESNSMNQIEKVFDKKDDILLGDITRIKSTNLVPKLPTDDDETQMTSQIPSEMVVDKHLSEDSISNNHGNGVVNGVSSAINEFLNSEDRRNTHLLAKQQQFDGSSSQGEDSVEGIWGSISVLSTQSDGQQCLNTVAPPSKPNTDNSDAAFDPPSFMTLVEECPQKEKQLKIVQKTQQPMSELVLQAAFPSVTNTNIAKETPGRKKNEEMISKVANWSMPKQHTPLKSLLLSETKLNSSSSSSPNWKKEQQTAENNNQNEEENSSLIKSGDDPAGGKGWNSPTRYPTNTGDETKKEKKRKVKGRPNWIQCVCCSSVH